MANALESLIADTLVRGRVEGKAEGKAEGKQEAILDLLSMRLGLLPDGLRAELASIVDGPTIGRLLAAARTAASLEEFCSALCTPDA